ncbi:psychosine receptor-like [Tachysurus ichikawai]
MEYTVPNGSYEASISPSRYSLKYNTSVNSRNLTSLATLAEIINDCNKNKSNGLRAYIQILNLSAIGYFYGNHPEPFRTTPEHCTSLCHPQLLRLPTFADQYVLGALWYVTYPVLFIKLGKREYRAACSAIIWFLTCIMAAFMFVYTIANMALILSIILNVLFLVMVACLVGIVCVLRKKGPGEGDQNNSSIKKHALKNVVAILVPSTITYFPMLGLAPFLLIIQILVIKSTNTDLCQFLMMFAVLPNFGICLGPMFYMARVKQMFCSRNNESGDTKEKTTVQKM